MGTENVVNWGFTSLHLEVGAGKAPAVRAQSLQSDGGSNENLSFICLFIYSREGVYIYASSKPLGELSLMQL